MSALSLLLAASLAAGFGSFSGTAQGGHTGSATPYVTSAAWYGDSIIQGAGSGTPPPEKLLALKGAGWVVKNKGISNESAAQIATRVISGAATACLDEPCGVYLLEGGVNTLKVSSLSTPAQLADLALNGDGGSDGTNDIGMLDAVDFLLSTYPNARLVWTGILPFTGCSEVLCPGLTQAHERALAFNAAMLAACATRSRLVCIDAYEAFEDPENTGYLLPAYSYDGIHLQQAGTDALSALASAALP